MRRHFKTTLAALALAVAGAAQADVVVGVIGPMTGQFARTGETWKEAIELYRKLNGDSAGGEKIRFIFKDLPDVNPAKARALVQELIVKDKANIVAGFLYTPNAIAGAPVATEGKVPLVIFNAAGVGLLDRSPYLLRVSYTQPQLTVPMANYALDNGIKRVAIVVSDYGSGHDVERTFEKQFTAKGGQITQKIRVPLDNFDFSPFMQTIKSAKPDAVLTFTPGGAVSIGLMKAFKDTGLDALGVKLLTVGGEVDEASTLKTLGKAALGAYSSSLYNPTGTSAENRTFRDAFTKEYPGVEIGVTHIEGWDGAHLIYHMVGATRGAKDGEKAVAAAKGYTWKSPRGNLQIDATNRDLIQDIHIRRVSEVGGVIANQGIKTYDKQPDWGRTP